MTPKRLSTQLSPHIDNTEVPDRYNPSPAQVLLASHLEGGARNRTLLIHTGPDILTEGLADRLAGGRLAWMGRDLAALSRAQTQLENYPRLPSQVSFDVELSLKDYNQFDQVALLIPKSRMLARRWLLTAWLALKPGSMLYLAGPNDLGIRSLIKDAEDVYRPATILGYKKGNRIARLRKPEGSPDLSAGPDWLSVPGIAPGTWQEFQFEWRDETRHFFSLPGVFSADRLDDGTRLLLDQLNLPQGATVLDFGCGSGVLGILTALMGAGSVDLVDIDLLAVASAQKNIAARQISNARCLASDGLTPVEGRRYDFILSNPPFHAGKPVSYRVTEAFIAGSKRLLKKSGQLIIVANRFIPYQQSLKRHYRKVNRLAEDNRYQVLSAARPIR
jgi:16S rRNA (guanine1207-N2)-methyltransferase